MEEPVLCSASTGFHFLLWKNLILVGSIITPAYATRARERVSIITERKYPGVGRGRPGGLARVSSCRQDAAQGGGLAGIPEAPLGSGCARESHTPVCDEAQ